MFLSLKPHSNKLHSLSHTLRTRTTRLYSPPAPTITDATNTSNITLLPLSKTKLYLPKLIVPILIGEAEPHFSSEAKGAIGDSRHHSVPVSHVHPYLTRATSRILTRSQQKEKQDLIYPILIGAAESHLSSEAKSVIGDSRHQSVPVSHVHPYLIRSASMILNLSEQKQNLVYLQKLITAPILIGDSKIHAYLFYHHLLQQSVPAMNSVSITSLTYNAHMKTWMEDNAAMTSANFNTLFQSPRSLLNRASPFVNFLSNTLLVPLRGITSRQYRGWPKLLPPKVTKPIDCNTLKQLRAKYAQVLAVPEDTISEAVTEIKYFACQNLTSDTQPKFRVHNLRASSKANNQVVSIIQPKIDPVALKLAKEDIEKDLKANNIDIEDLKEIWFDDKGSPEEFWAYSMVKHSNYSKKDQIESYASLTHKLAAPVLTGSNTLGEFLEKKGFITGKYHEVQDLLVALKEYFKGKDAYPTFVCQGTHPSLFEVGVLSIGEEIIDHPMIAIVPMGKFLMRKI